MSAKGGKRTLITSLDLCASTSSAVGGKGRHCWEECRVSRTAVRKGGSWIAALPDGATGLFVWPTLVCEFAWIDKYLLQDTQDPEDDYDHHHSHDEPNDTPHQFFPFRL